jgi:hypothetical protein
LAAPSTSVLPSKTIVTFAVAERSLRVDRNRVQPIPVVPHVANVPLALTF